MVIFERNDLRISLLTSRLLRIEKGAVTDLPTQTVMHRDFPPVKHTLIEQGKSLFVQTEENGFHINLASGKVVKVSFAEGYYTKNIGHGQLPGTARTLDQANGAVRLNPGIIARDGVAVMDDSKSLLLNPDGTIAPRPKCTDRYYFAYGNDYLRQMQDFYRLTGPVPLIPKFALGNWWSRYRAYTQEEYRSLMQAFIDKRIPITVATIDMDWHWVDVLQRFGPDAKPGKPRSKEELFYNKLLPGWTGYTWNTELFPDHQQLLSWLHENGFKVPLNVHPSQGIRFFEKAYESACQRLGKDPATRELIPFDPTDPAFMQVYFEQLHHPLEEEGVDFWWLDWQQGKNTKIPGLDPLWALNHYHTLDAARNGKRPLILSRYAGLGSHRYPLGFSGDTHVTWKSLEFQPYFTNTAANAGYSWWSHDIGGHMLGVQDDELYLRWLQYGVFSPVNRLHSSNSEFMGKEPWKRSWMAEKLAEQFLRLRHKLIPYLYTGNYRTHTAGEPLCMPLYYRHQCPQAYEAKNEYYFGSQLLVSPITKPAHRKLNLGFADTWLPEGRWTDIFTGRIYNGGRWVRMYRDMDSIPVLAREGAIVPMYRSGESNDLSLQQDLEIHLWRGNGSFELYEDDGVSMDYQQGAFAITTFELQEQGDELRLTITPPRDAHGLLPKQRKMYLNFRDVEAEERCVLVEDQSVSIVLKNVKCRQNPPREELQGNLLTRIQMGNAWKSRKFKKKFPNFVNRALRELDALWYPEK